MKYIIFIIFNSIITISYSQNISGIVMDSNHIGIENASVYVWSSVQKDHLIHYMYTNQEGRFSIEFEGKKEVFIEIKCINYDIFYKNINFKINNLEIILNKKETILEEVIVNNQKAVSVKNDSTFYNPEKFLNGTERKVEDLLKKLPGISVNDNTGQIKFKGKDIETVKLENDDLFGSNYMLGTKHISVDMIEQVQAIENYSSNSLLKNIENSDKVVLNLKLKKNKTDFSGNINAENGYEKSILTSNEITVLGINKKIKLFGILTQANFGIDTQNFEPSNENSDATFNIDYFTKKNLYEQQIHSNLPSKITFKNDYLYANFNIIYNLNKKFKIKNNIFAYKDKQITYENINTKFINQIVNNRNNSNILNPKYLRFDNKFSYIINSNSIVEGSIILKNNNTLNTYHSLFNNETQYQTVLRTTDLFFKTDINYTIKLAAKKVLQFKTVFSKNNIPQKVLSESNSIVNPQEKQLNYLQNSTFSKQIIENSIHYYTKTRNLKSVFSLTNLNETNLFHSDGVFNYNTNYFINNFKNNKYITNLGVTSMLNIQKIKLQPQIAINFYQQKLGDLMSHDCKLTHKLTASYTINKHSIALINSNIFDTPVEDYLFSNNVILDPYTVKNNKLSLRLIQNNISSLSYKYDNLSKLIFIKLSFDYNFSINTYAHNIDITSDLLTYTYFQTPSKIQARSLNLEINKLIKPLHLTIKNDIHYTNNQYINTINQSINRINIENKFTNNLYLFSSFNFPINIEEKFNYTNTKYISNNNLNYTINSLYFTSKVNIKINDKILIIGTHDYYLPNTDSKEQLHLFDCQFHYKSKNKNGINFSIISKNILNNTFNYLTTTNDFSIQVYKTPILGRHFLMSMALDF